MKLQRAMYESDTTSLFPGIARCDVDLDAFSPLLNSVQCSSPGSGDQRTEACCGAVLCEPYIQRYESFSRVGVLIVVPLPWLTDFLTVDDVEQSVHLDMYLKVNWKSEKWIGKTDDEFQAGSLMLLLRRSALIFAAQMTRSSRKTGGPQALK